MLGLDVMQPGNPSGFYVITDDKPQYFWKVIDSVVVRSGGRSLYTKYAVPKIIMYGVAYLFLLIGKITGKPSRITPFTVTSMTMDRYFNIEDAEKDLKYKPLKSFDPGWEETLQWFHKYPEYIKVRAENALVGKPPNQTKI
jgi:nucleoside-diphosphate-sugar epimerase